MSKSFPTVHKLDARALMKISRLPWKDFSLSLSPREIFFLPLGSRVLIGQRNFEGIVFWERAYMRVCTPRGAVIGTGFRTGSRCGSRKLRKSNEPLVVGKLCERWMIVDVTFLYKSIDVEFIFIYSCLPVAYFFKSLPRFKELSTTFNFEFRIRSGFFEKLGNCLVLSRRFLSRQREEFSWFHFIWSLLESELFSNWLKDYCESKIEGRDEE